MEAEYDNYIEDMDYESMEQADFLERLEMLEDSDIFYESTRPGGDTADFWHTLIQGLAENKGLYMPIENPEAFGPGFIKNVLPTLSVAQISTSLLRKFIPREDIADDELLELMEEAHNFGIPLEKIEDNTWAAWLDQGPTASFKDIAARCIAKLLEKNCEVNQKPRNIVVATSGDTGVAIANAFADSKWVTVTILYPTDGVSEIQEKQMLYTAAKHANIQVVPVKGTFDDCQNMAKTLLEARDVDLEVDGSVQDFRARIKKVVGDELSDDETQDLIETAKKMNLFSANSINIWRLVPQMTQYFASYASLVRTGEIEAGEEIVLSVPTGNVGHLIAGVFAKELGLPIKKFVVGNNQNNILEHVIHDGVILHKGLEPTLAPSMDILNPSNLERLLYVAAKNTASDTDIDYEGIKDEIRDINTKLKKKYLFSLVVHAGMDDFSEEGVKEALKKLIAEEEFTELMPDLKEKFAPLIEDKEGELMEILGIDGGLDREYIDDEISVPLQPFGVTDEMLAWLQENFFVRSTTDNREMVEIIEEVYENTNEQVLLESHGSTGQKVQAEARKAGFISKDDKVVVLETAHPNKFPDALEQAGIEDTPRKHPELEKLMALDIADMDKPEATNLILSVRDQMKEIAEASAEARAA